MLHTNSLVNMRYGDTPWLATQSPLTLKPTENFLEMCVYTIWALMATLGGVT